jgi:hypothetical protein
MKSEQKKKYEVVVGIPSYNESDTITHVTEVVGEGLKGYFQGRKSIIVNVDNNSLDNTQEAFLDAKTKIEKRYISTGEGVVGKGNNILNLLKFASQVDAEIIIIVDADLRSISQEWVGYLGQPIEEGYDYVIPLYSRHQFDATITNHICYPLVYSLLSVDIRQPIGGEFSFSSRMMNHWLKQKWHESVRQYGIDIFMTLHALLGDFKICQSGLGTKIHKASAPKIGIMFDQVVETLLTLLLQYKKKWHAKWNNTVVKPEVFGIKTLTEPQEIEINMYALKESCKDAYKINETSIKDLLGHYAFSRIDEMFKMDNYEISTLLWTQIIYSLMHKFDTAKNSEDRRKVINVLKPLYFARSISFNYNTWKYNVKYSEQEIRNQALAFASQKYYLLGLYGNSF